MKRRGLPMTLALAALLIGGCAMDLDEASTTDGPRGAIAGDDGRAAPINDDWAVAGDPNEAEDGWLDGEDSRSLDVVDARLEGAIGPVGSLSHQADETTSYADGYWSTLSVTVDKGNGQGAAMAILDMEGDMRALEPGTYHIDFADRSSDEFLENGPTGPQNMYIIGCSGDNPGEWSFDQPADEADLSVTYDDDADVLNITFTADFSNGTVYDWETGDAHEVGRSTVTGTVSIKR